MDLGTKKSLILHIQMHLAMPPHFEIFCHMSNLLNMLSLDHELILLRRRTIKLSIDK